MWKQLAKNKISLLSAVLLVTALCAVPASYGWFTSPRQNISMGQTGGEFRAQYFHSGNGTEENPFVITRPIHFYNMVNLYQRVSDYSEQEYYFQIGANDIEGHTDGYYVYAYNENGEIATDENGDFIYTHELNLACYTKVEDNDNSLAPIGTYDKNFRGTFDGKGNTVSGFTVSVSGLDNETECDIGIFGYVGEGASIKDVYFEDVTIDLTGLSNVVSASTGSQTHNYRIHTMGGQTVAYAGYLAGHIAATSSCQRVYLNDVTMTGGGAAVSSFGYFGCVENDDGSSVQTLGQSISTQWASGDSAGWGGSLNMKNMLNRLLDVRSESTSDFEYPSAETIVLEEDTQKVVSRDVTAMASGTSEHSGNLLNFQLYQSTSGGTYYFNNYSNESGTIYLSGFNEFQNKTVSTYIASDSEGEAIYICDTDAGNFLSAGSNYEIINITSRDNASKWLTEDTDESGSGMKYLYTRIGVRPYYLNASGTSLVLSTEKESKWMIAQDPVGLYQVIFTASASGNSYYYLKFEDAWQLVTNETTYAIGDGDGHYLNTDGSSISTETTAGAATAWKIVVNGGQASFSVTVGNVEKYLAYESGTGLKLSATPFTWSQTLVSAAEMEYSYSYTDSTENITWYLAYENGWKVVRLTGKTISCTETEEADPVYLRANGALDGVTASLTTGCTACWQMSTDASVTGIRLDYNGKHYYLGADTATGELTLEEYAFGDAGIPKWCRDTDAGKYYIVSGNTRYYLTYQNGWRVESGTRYSIQYNDDSQIHYLGMDPETAGQVKDYLESDEEYTRFVIEDLTGEGRMYVTVGGENWYLTAEQNESGGIELKFRSAEDVWSPEDAVQWKKNGTGFYTTLTKDGLSRDYYLYYDGGWCLQELYFTFYTTLDDGEDEPEFYLARTSGVDGAVVTALDPSGYEENPESALWMFNGKNIWTRADNKDYCLTFSAENESPVLVQTSGTDVPFEWTVTDTSISATVNGVTYSLRVIDGSWVTMRTDLYSICYDGNRLKFAYTTGPVIRNTTEDEIAAYWRIYESGSACAISHTLNVEGTATEYFLNADAIGNLSLSTEQKSVWYVEEYWVDEDEGIQGERLYYLSSGNRFYLSYLEEDEEVEVDEEVEEGEEGEENEENEEDYNPWRARAFAAVVFEHDGHYIGLEGEEGKIPKVTDSTEEDEAVQWWVSSDTEPTTIFTVYAGVLYYLNVNTSDGALFVSESAQTWNYDDENGYYVPGIDELYLTYDASNGRGWCCLTLDEEYSCITDSLGNYLRYEIAVAEFSNAIESENATKWKISDEDSDGTVTISATIGTDVLYLSESGGSLAMATIPAYWHKQYGTYYLEDSTNTKRYYLVCEGTVWKLNSTPTSYYIYTEENNKKYYLVPASTTSFTGLEGLNATNYQQCKWTFASFDNTAFAPGTGKLSITYSGKLHYLRVKKSNYGLSISTKSESGYSYSWSYDTYLYTTGASSVQIDLEYDSKNKKWKMVKHAEGETGSKITLNVYGCACAVESTYSATVPEPDVLEPAGTEGGDDHTIKHGYYISGICSECSGSPVGVQGVEIEDIPGDILLETPSVRWNERSGNHSVRTLDTTTAQEYTEKAGSPKTVKGGYETCIPLKVDLQDEENASSWYSDYRVSSENTGYIISGANQTSPVDATLRSDLRVSKYNTKEIYKAFNGKSYSSPIYDIDYDSRMQVLTRTAAVDASTEGYVRIKDSRNSENIDNYYAGSDGLPEECMTVTDLGLTKYEAENVELSRDAFYNMLSGSNQIYGLHFMESTIPDIYGNETETELAELRERIIYADQATILGKTYQYYELPEDCIDFKVAERGAVSIFAGTFYTYDTTSFFSLHHVKRDSNQHIETIKEIREIYKKTDSDTAAYVYVYGDGSLSIPGTDLSSYEKIFDMSWVTNFDQDGDQLADLVQNAVYYFEIPVNSGEYALGSVENGIGAYLMYMDIGTNGGGVIENKISIAGSGVSSLFKVEYRSKGMTDLFPTEGSLANSLLQFSVSAPEANASDYSVHMEFIKEENPTAEELADHPGGLYVITVNNRTAGDIELTVFVCDNDSIEGNDYPYSYKIMYTDKSQTTPAVYPSSTLWYKTCTRFVIGNGDS